MDILTLTKTVGAVLQDANFAKSSLDVSEDERESFYKICKAQDISHFVGRALVNSGAPLQDELSKKFKKDYMLSVVRCENLIFTLDSVSGLLENEKIDHIILKGSVLREYYPEAWMRTSSDIDILVHREDAERAKDLICEKLGYTFKIKDRYDICIVSDGGVHIELHFDLFEEKVLERTDKPLEDVWEYSYKKEGKEHTFLMKEDMFYYYHIAHMAKHFVLGGCGVRPFIDIQMLKRAGVSLETAHELLQKGGLLTFAKNAEHLSRVWFEDGVHTETTAQMEEYIVPSGIYGNLVNHAAVQALKKGSGVKYAIGRIWIPYEALVRHYPSLEGKKGLTFFYQARRWAKLIFRGGGKRGIHELRASNVSKETKNGLESMLASLDL